MKVALFGYGKMGKEIERQLLDLGHQVPLIVTAQNALQVANYPEQLKNCDRPKSQSFNNGFPLESKDNKILVFINKIQYS